MFYFFREFFLQVILNALLNDLNLTNHTIKETSEMNLPSVFWLTLLDCY